MSAIAPWQMDNMNFTAYTSLLSKQGMESIKNILFDQ